jgi:hypothetical protein
LEKRAKIFAQWTWMTVKGLADVALNEEEVFGMPVVTKKGANLDRTKMTAYHQKMLDFGLRKCLGITGYTVEPAPTFTEVNYQPERVVPSVGGPSSVVSPPSVGSFSSSSSASSNLGPRQPPPSASGDRLCRPDVVQELSGGYAVNLTTGGKVAVSGPSKNQLKKAAREQKKQQAAAAASSARVVEPSPTAHPQRKSISDIDIAALRSGRPLPGSASGNPPTISGLPGTATPQPTGQPAQSFSAAADNNNNVLEHISTTAARDVGHFNHAEHQNLYDLTDADVAGLPAAVEGQAEGLGGSLVGQAGEEPATTFDMATEERAGGGFDGHHSSPAAEEAEDGFHIEDWVHMDMFTGDSHFSPPSAAGRSSVGQSSSAPRDDEPELMPVEDVMKLLEAIQD